MSLVPDNRTAFALRALSARAAARTLDLQYYTWHEDVTGRLLTREVLRAADRGTRVRLLLDDLYVRGAERGLATLASHPFVDVRLYNPFRFRAWGALGGAAAYLLAGWRLNHRMHNKVWIVDGRLAIGGGRNIGDEYFDAARQFNFRDLDLVVEGGAVSQAVAHFERYWHSTRVRPIEAVAASCQLDGGLDELRRWPDGGDAAVLATEYLRGMGGARGQLDGLLAKERVPVPDDAIRIVADPPNKGRGRHRAPGMLDEVRRAIDAARREVVLVSPYFVPGRRGSRLLAALVRRGVRVSVLTNSLAATDVLAVHGGYARYRRRLLRAGVAFRELKRGGQQGGRLFGSGGSASLHTKALLVDGELIFVGSYNFDPRSAHLNTEMGTFVRHPTLGGQLRQEYGRLADPDRSWAVRLEAGGLIWIDREPDGRERRAYRAEPGTTLARRALASVLGWLPIEPQL